MNVLILLEDEKYLSLAEGIKTNPQIKVEVNNIDFNLTTSISACQVIIFLGDEDSYQIFMTEYQGLISSKLIVRTAECVASESAFDIVANIDCGVGLLALPKLDSDLQAVVVQSLQTIFDGQLQLMFTTVADYQQQLKILNNFKKAVIELAEDYRTELNLNIIKQLLSNSNVK